MRIGRDLARGAGAVGIIVVGEHVRSIVIEVPGGDDFLAEPAAQRVVVVIDPVIDDCDGLSRAGDAWEINRGLIEADLMILRAPGTGGKHLPGFEGFGSEST